MAIELNKQEAAEIVTSLQRYVREELDQEIGELRAGLLLGYIMREIAPFAYNKGIRDAESFFRSKVEDLPGTCFEPTMTFWTRKPRR